jgi:hypothetical protein
MVGFGTSPRMACAASLSQLRGVEAARDAGRVRTGQSAFGPTSSRVDRCSATVRFTRLTSARASISTSRHTARSALTWRATISGLLHGCEKSAK